MGKTTPSLLLSATEQFGEIAKDFDEVEVAVVKLGRNVAGLRKRVDLLRATIVAAIEANGGTAPAPPPLKPPRVACEDCEGCAGHCPRTVAG